MIGDKATIDQPTREAEEPLGTAPSQPRGYRLDKLWCRRISSRMDRKQSTTRWRWRSVSMPL